MLSSSQLNLWILFWFWGGVSLIAIMELLKKVRAHNLKLVLVGIEENNNNDIPGSKKYIILISRKP
jgi:hypothetical protein